MIERIFKFILAFGMLGACGASTYTVLHRIEREGLTDPVPVIICVGLAILGGYACAFLDKNMK